MKRIMWEPNKYQNEREDYLGLPSFVSYMFRDLSLVVVEEGQLRCWIQGIDLQVCEDE